MTDHRSNRNEQRRARALQQSRGISYMQALAEVRRYKLGDPLESATSMGPLAQPGAPEKLSAQVEEARAKGGRVLCGGTPVHDGAGRGRFFDPCLVVEANHAMHGLMVEESFGPIVGVQKVADDDEAVSIAKARAELGFDPTFRIGQRT